MEKALRTFGVKEASNRIHILIKNLKNHKTTFYYLGIKLHQIIDQNLDHPTLVGIPLYYLMMKFLHQCFVT
jgi:hypothetical protein